MLEKLSSENIKTIVLRALEFLEVNIIQDNKETASVKGSWNDCGVTNRFCYFFFIFLLLKRDLELANSSSEV